MAYALSVAAVDSASKALGKPLVNLLRENKPCTNPYPLGNFLGGGAHAGPGTPDIQEILVCPIGAVNIVQALEMNFYVHHELRKLLERHPANISLLVKHLPVASNPKSLLACHGTARYRHDIATTPGALM